MVVPFPYLMWENACKHRRFQWVEIISSYPYCPFLGSSSYSTLGFDFMKDGFKSKMEEKKAKTIFECMSQYVLGVEEAFKPLDCKYHKTRSSDLSLISGSSFNQHSV